jgi:hypothetical protein
MNRNYKVQIRKSQGHNQLNKNKLNHNLQDQNKEILMILLRKSKKFQK